MTLPDLETVENVPVHDLVFFLFRNVSRSPLVTSLVKAVIDNLSRVVDSRITLLRHKNIPDCKLTRESAEVADAIRKALKGDDKLHRILNTPCFFLRKNQGTAAEAFDHYVLKEIIYSKSFKQYAHELSHALNAAYLRQCRYSMGRRKFIKQSSSQTRPAGLDMETEGTRG